jgi:hypothetical protein
MPIEIGSISAEAMYSVAEVAELLELSDQSVRLYLVNGKLRGVKGLNSRWRVPGHEILRFIGPATLPRRRNEGSSVARDRIRRR